MEYSAARIREILKQLGITPFPGNMVSSSQAATIMTWRVKEEQGIAHQYRDIHVRRHISAGTLKPASQVHSRFKLFEARDIFALELIPKRGEGARERENRKRPTAPRLPAVKPDEIAA